MIEVRRSDERGTTRTDWLDSRHSFSFGEYRDPRHVGFRALRVVNEDRVRPGQGFAPHSHRDMEILTWILEGALQHRDSLGNGSVIRPGEIQRMSAGTGITHSEYNPSPSQPVHFLQLWIVPSERDVSPSYEQREVPESERRNGLRLVASPDGAAGSVRLHQDARVHAALLDPGREVRLPLAAGRHAWVQVARGGVAVNGTPLSAGDGAALAGESAVVLAAREPAEVLLFDLA
jgi:redox-sensitive bicupin YhaK (pirin superfamily)